MEVMESVFEKVSFIFLLELKWTKRGEKRIEQGKKEKWE